jgi:hypothetical protein
MMTINVLLPNSKTVNALAVSYVIKDVRAAIAALLVAKPVGKAAGVLVTVEGIT